MKLNGFLNELYISSASGKPANYSIMLQRKLIMAFRKTALASILITISLLLAGCSFGQPGTETKGTESTEVTISSEKTEVTETSGSSEAKSGHPESSISFLRKMIEEINEVDAQAEQMGYHPLRTILLMRFTEDKDPYEPVETVQADKNSITATTVMRIEEADFDGSSDFQTAAMLLLNGKSVEFSIDGKSSEGGILTTSLQTNKDYVMSVSANDLPVIEGKNKLTLLVFNYSKDKELYLDCQNDSVFFTSEQAYGGNVISACPESDINVFTAKDQSEADQFPSRSFIVPDEFVDFESDHYGYALTKTRSNPTMHFYISNMDNEDVNGDRSGFMLLFVDGKMQNVWNGKRFGEINIAEKDLLKVIKIKTDYKAGERHNVSWFYIETSDASRWIPVYRFSMLLQIE